MLTNQPVKERVAIPLEQLDAVVALIRQKGARPRAEIAAHFHALGWPPEYTGIVINTARDFKLVFEYSGRLYARLEQGGK